MKRRVWRRMWAGAAILSILVVTRVHAASGQAYQDYQYQFDQYRQRLSQYQTAINEYKKFNSLTSQQAAVSAVQALLPQRNLAAKSYFLFLNEKITENPELSSVELATYRGKITTQTTFLDTNSVKVGSIETLQDAAAISDEFVKNYKVMQADYRQVIAGIELGYLNYFAKKFDQAAARAQALIQASKGDVTPEKQATFDRWLLALSNQHSLYEQKAKAIQLAIPKITGDLQGQERDFAKTQTMISQARQDLVEGASYLKEVEDALHYE